MSGGGSQTNGAYSRAMATPRSDPLSTTADVVRALAVLVGLAAVVAAVVVAVHTVPACSANPYGGAPVCDATRHPFLGLAAGIAVGGVLWAIALEVLGQVARAVGEVRGRLTPAAPRAARAPSHLDEDGL